MHPQLRAIEGELLAAREALRALDARLPRDRWAIAPAPGAWSVAQCVEHLNLTSRAMLPGLRAAVGEARRMGGGAPERFRRGVFGWLIWRASRPTVRMRVRTPPAFDPPAPPPAAELIAEFERFQDEQLELLRSADGLPLHRVKVASPFGSASYNAFAALSILSVHQLRHLQQAERAAETVAG